MAVPRKAVAKEEEEAGGALDRQILALAVPSLVALCAEPILSIIDTGFVGRLPEPALALGGLGIASSVFDFVFRCYNFLCVVVVPLVAQAIVKQRRGDPEADDPAEITGRVIGLAFFLGIVTSTCLICGTPFALQLAGATPDSALGGVAASYLQIRASALPASLVNTVAVGAFRGHLDTATPLKVVVLQSIADAVGDAVLVFGFPLLGIPAMGVEGAALATAAALWLSCLVFCYVLTQRGLVAWKAALTWPLALREMQPLVAGGISQLVRTLALQAVLLEFTKTVVALDSGGLAAAAHQVALRTWFFALFALDSVAVAAQGLLPTALANSGKEGARSVAERLLLWGFGGGICTALVLALGAGTIPGIFTDSPEVQAEARPLILLLAALQPLAGLVFTWDGMFQGLTDYSYLAAAMFAAAALTISALQVAPLHSSLEGVWVCFALFLLLRAAGLVFRYWGPGPLSTPASESMAVAGESRK